MKRIEFLKRLVAGAFALSSAPALIASEPNKDEPSTFTFDELFRVHPGNDILVYPKASSPFYKQFEEQFAERIDKTKSHVYYPVHSVILPVKEFYTIEDFKPVMFYFDCVYFKKQKFTTEYSGKTSDCVCFRFVKDAPDRMHLDIFAHYVTY